METAIILIIIAAICAYSIFRYVRKLTRGGGCCGERDPREKRVKVEDKDPSHYPYHLNLQLDGMTCQNCVRRVENALNSIDGVWASVSLEGQTALVRLKTPPDEQLIRQTVRNAGYAVLKVSQ